MPVRRQRWDIFCRVVDNFGDIGVCWRLAKQLSDEHGLHVRLWVDDLITAKRLIPQLNITRADQSLHGISICHWQQDFVVDQLADVVIEAFACELPQAYLQAMTGQPASSQPAWLNLEYLSAESWIEDFHLQPSPHPQLSLKKTFFFPGWTAASGGLLRENNLLTTRNRFRHNLPADRLQILKVSLFCYPSAPIQNLLGAMAQSESPVHCYIPQSSILDEVSAFLGTGALAVGQHKQQGQLTVEILPFLSQDDYDRLLWSCDLNFVRGEDSWVRALWAGKPFIWQPYFQPENVHLAKMEAFFKRYAEDLASEPRQTLHQFYRAWVAGELKQTHWQALQSHLPLIEQYAGKRSADFALLPDLAAKLVIFCKNFS